MTIKRFYILVFFSVFISLFTNCGNKVNTTENTTKESKEFEQTDTTQLISNSKENTELHITIIEVDSTYYNSKKRKLNPINTNLKEITDVDKLKAMFKDVLVFNEPEENPIIEGPSLKEINFRNGKTITSENSLLNDCGFMSYFPDEEIILLKNPAGGDVSISLKNGNEVFENPKYIKYSPSKSYRLNGYKNGEGIHTYFIQKKVNNEYVDIISDLTEEFYKAVQYENIFKISDSYWENEKVLYVKVRNNGNNSQYYKIEI